MRFIAGLFVLLIALLLQFFLAAAGFHLNLALAILIAFAFIFSFAELAVFDLLTVFIINWKPTASVEMIVFALIPLAAFAFRKLIHSEPWIGNLVAVIAGFIIFYLTASPSAFIPHILTFLEDLAVCLIAGEAALSILL